MKDNAPTYLVWQTDSSGLITLGLSGDDPLDLAPKVPEKVDSLDHTGVVLDQGFA